MAELAATGPISRVKSLTRTMLAGLASVQTLLGIEDPEAEEGQPPLSDEAIAAARLAEATGRVFLHLVDPRVHEWPLIWIVDGSGLTWTSDGAGVGDAWPS